MTSPPAIAAGPTLVIQRVSNPHLQLECGFGTTDPKVTDGYGGWKVIDRDLRMGLTVWAGPPPQRLALQILLDGFFAGVAGQPVGGLVDYVTTNFTGSGDKEPPPVRVKGVYPVDPGMQWVCDGWVIDEWITRRSDRRPIRVLGTFSFLRYVPGELLVKTTAAKRSKTTSTRTGGKTYTVRAGDTLSSIAAKQLGDYRKASAIASLNGIRDGKSLKAGQRLKLP